MTVNERVSALRVLMKKNGLSAYIIRGTDPHASEYMAPHWMEMSWITGFLGESGTAVVTMDQALLWTDSRYYLQAGEELKGSEYKLMRESDVDCPTIAEWLLSTFNFQLSTKIGVNPEMYSIDGYRLLQTELEDGGLRLMSIDLIAPIWTEGRPDIPMNPLYIYEDCYAGERVGAKLERVRDMLSAHRCDALVIAELDEIGWLLNIRGTDVDYTPCVIAYCVVEKTRCTLFVDSRKVCDADAAVLRGKGVELMPYHAVFDYLKNISATRVMMDGNRVNEALYECVLSSVSHAACKVVTPSPLQVMMSVKNDIELAGTRLAMRQDAVALTRFFRWLETEALQSPQTEITLADRLHAYRAMGTHFTDESFGTIAGWNANGAIVHYAAKPESCAAITGNGVLLLDSGGQYLDGTTDITRTVWVGDEKAIPAQLKRDFTLVLKGHIALARARFPKGTRGNQLDVLAHQFMWAEGVTYGHGTGHGVGHFMGCHEGPANIRTDNNTNPIHLGNVFSDEPGIYRAGEYGIRTENLIATRQAAPSPRSTGETYYEFETLTLCFYDKRLMEFSMLTPDEVAWINDYHAWVEREVTPLLNEDEAAYLHTKCLPI
ncbi:MAG: aminopeptidase P family N-terminal domain-containing protein [Paludibacteraceae bacterium]|nr:aminopeptidase P family N-terminal domain-containing protein [Paludibacteraceae bacterium]